MTVSFQRTLLFLALFNASLNSFAKGCRRSQRNAYSYRGEESSETSDVFQSVSDDKASEEERVLSAIARAEASGNDQSAGYSMSDDSACSDRMDQGIDKSFSTNAYQRPREFGISDAVEGGAKSSSRTAAQSARISVPIGGQNKQQPKGLRSDLWQTRTSQPTTIRKEYDVQKQSTMPIQRVKGSAIDAEKSQKPSSTSTPWIRRYLSSRPRDVLLPVPKDFIADGFNVAKLGPIVERIGFQVAGEHAVAIAKELMQVSTRSYPIYRLALQLILNETEDDSFVLQHSLVPPQVLHTTAEALYLMIHSRFCQSARGLDSLKRIVRAEMFGKCPRVSCGGAPLLPYGASNDFSVELRNSVCQRFCPKCGEVWIWWDSKTDGCAFGPSLCHLFLLTHGAEIFPLEKLSTKDADTSRAPFRVMGFRIHPATIWGRATSRRAG